VAKRTRVLVVGVVLIVALAVLGVTLLGGSSGGDYASFADCPLGDPATDLCIFARAESGGLTIGKQTIPITKTLILQGGIHQDGAAGQQRFIGVERGETLSVVPQTIPGGLRGIIARAMLSSTLRGRLDRLLARGAGTVTATTELAGPASTIGVSTQNLVEAKGVGISLPLKVKLSGPFLGESCYIGSGADPIVIALTTGRTHRSSTYGPLDGKPGHARFKDNYNLVTLSGNSLIGDSFAAPRVSGCGGGLAAQLDPALDIVLGLPVAAGHSEAILNGTLETANAPAVKASR
jgi:hypothetical protein